MSRHVLPSSAYWLWKPMRRATSECARLLGMAMTISGLSLLGAEALSAQTARVVTTPQTRVELMSAVQTAPPEGGDVWLGIHFRMRDTWHIYWRNPGDSGIPPTVTWHVPDGVRAGEIEWP